MQQFKRTISTVLGFGKLSQYEKDYLHEANLHANMCIGLLTVVLEIWMLLRQTYSRVIPNVQSGMDLSDAVLKYTTKYWLFLLVGFSLTVFCRFCQTHKSGRMSLGWFIVLLLTGLVDIAYTCMLQYENYTRVSDEVTTVMATIMNVTLVCIYLCLLVIGVTIIIYALCRYFKNTRLALLEHVAIITFAVACFDFGVFVSYSDFWGGKEITCFLMMMVYVGYLLIYRPYITIVMLVTGFAVFHRVLLTYQDGMSFHPKEIMINGVPHMISSGDMVNYMTFLAALATICIAIYHGRLKEANESRRIYRLFGQTAEALAGAIDAKDKYTHGHSLRVADYSLRIARAVGKSETECREIYYAALLHDVGKIGVPDRIIQKEGKLTEEEFDEIKLHPVHGNNILSRISESPYLSIGAQYHHERYDGRGYPVGLKGEDIPELARIIAVADAYDAMTSKRSYRDPLPQQRVREEMYKGVGTQFDPVFAHTMIKLIDQDTAYLLQEGDQRTNQGSTSKLNCSELYAECTEGTHLTDHIVRVHLYSRPDENYSEKESLPSIVLYDSLDGWVHRDESGRKNLMYFEYARIRLDGEIYSAGVRRIEKYVTEGAGNGQDAVSQERGARFDIVAVRQKDHLWITVKNANRMIEYVIALPDSVRYSYLAITGKNCEINNIHIETDAHTIPDGYIRRIAPEVSYIADAPVGDIPNIQIEGWRANTTVGIPLQGKTILKFHTKSLPMAWLIWHCPFIVVYTSENGQVSGEAFQEYGVFRLDGEAWEPNEHAENIIETDQTMEFGGWNVWKEKHKEGLDITVTLERDGNIVTMETENLGLYVHAKAIVHDEVETLYAAITGDECAITDIHVE